MNPTDVSTPPAGQTAGQMLRAAREQQGMHLALLSVNLKVSLAQLEALEADRHDVFKGVAFVRALALSVCRQLKLDPTPVLAALPQHQAPSKLEPVSLEVQQRVKVSVSSRGSAAKGPSRQVLLLGLVMLLSAAVLIWWPETAGQDPEPPADPVLSMVPAPQALEPASEPAATHEAATPPVSVPVAVAAAPSVPEPAVSAVTASSNSAASSATVAPGLSTLELRMTGDTSVTVRDKNNAIVLRQQFQAGETAKLEIQAPWFVYVNRADAAQLRWQGRMIDLKPYTHENIARVWIRP